MGASPKARAVARRIERDRDKAETVGLRVTKPLIVAAKSHVIRAFKTGHNWQAALHGQLTALPAIVTDTMVDAHLRGRLRVNLEAHAYKRTHGKKAKKLGLQDDALKFLMGRLELDPADIASLRQLYGDEAIKAAKGFSDAISRKVSEAVAESTAAGEHVEDGMERIRQAFDAAGINNASPWLTETLYRTQTQLAYAAGRMNAANDPDIQEILWGFEYATAGDDRVRPEHAILDGVRRPKDDAFWSVNMPPNGYNCRCTVIEIFNEEDLAVATDLPETSIDDDTGEEIVPGADDGFKFNPGNLFQDVLS